MSHWRYWRTQDDRMGSEWIAILWHREAAYQLLLPLCKEYTQRLDQEANVIRVRKKLANQVPDLVSYRYTVRANRGEIVRAVLKNMLGKLIIYLYKTRNGSKPELAGRLANHLAHLIYTWQQTCRDELQLYNWEFIMYIHIQEPPWDLTVPLHSYLKYSCLARSNLSVWILATDVDALSSVTSDWKKEDLSRKYRKRPDQLAKVNLSFELSQHKVPPFRTLNACVIAYPLLISLHASLCLMQSWCSRLQT